MSFFKRYGLGILLLFLSILLLATSLWVSWGAYLNDVKIHNANPDYDNFLLLWASRNVERLAIGLLQVFIFILATSKLKFEGSKQSK